MAKRGKSSFNGWTLLALLFVLGFIVQYFIPIVVVLGLAGTGYYFFKRNQTNQQVSLTMQVDELKKLIASTDRKIHRLDQYKKEDSERYIALAGEVEGQLAIIEDKTQRLQTEIEPAVVKRIFDKIDEVREEISLSRAELEETHKTPSFKDLPEDVQQIIRNIKIDHKAITEKIEQSESGNKEELMAVHHMQMERFEDILEGYQKMLEAPKNYYHAKERLEAAVSAMKQFDLDLDETLKQLNEADMRDFDISLRIIKHKTREEDKGDSHE
ncbi:hypothetical protein AB1I63_00255 [Streptococcus pneumoniae]